MTPVPSAATLLVVASAACAQPCLTLTPIDLEGPEDGAAVYDAARDRVVLFDGGIPGAGKTDTWEFDGEDWSLVATEGPGPRDYFAMAYDPARAVTLLFGGVWAQGKGGPGHYADTWQWDGKEWTLVAESGPSARG